VLVLADRGKCRNRSGTAEVCMGVVDAGIDDGDLDVLARNPGTPCHTAGAPMNGTLTTFWMLYWVRRPLA